MQEKGLRGKQPSGCRDLTKPPCNLVSHFWEADREEGNFPSKRSRWAGAAARL